jgi:putative membrane protein
MNHPKSSISKVSAVIVVASVAACGHQSQTSAPPTMQSTPATSEEYGSAMGQPAASGTMTPENTAPTPPSGESATGPDTTSGQSSGGALGASPAPMMGPENMGSSGGGMGGTMGGTMAAMDVSGMTDAQLAAIVQTANAGEIQEAQLAEAKASSPEVKRFAHEMMNGHRDMLVRQNALFTRLQIMPSDNAVSNQLKTESQNQISMLQGVRGQDFDRAYMADQVRGHSKSLEMVDRIVPNVKNPDFRMALQNDRPKMEAHLREAEAIQQALQKGTTNVQPGSPETPNPPHPGITPYVH